jgi:putative Mg2+ transporter-C (MgtC) family protein
MNPSDIDEFHEVLLRLGFAMILGAILGIDRDMHRKPAGLRVLSMVCLGSCAVIMVSITTIASAAGTAGEGLLRTVQGVLSGIGFLGAGVIMRTQGTDQVHGLTTASSIWISAILGMICGTGQWMLASCLFLFSWCLLVFGRWIEMRILQLSQPKSITSVPAVAKPSNRTVDNAE